MSNWSTERVAMTSRTPSRRLVVVGVVVALVVHLMMLWGAWDRASRLRGGQDFASFHYAARVAAEGGDPYRVSALNEVARQEGLRRGAVHPFFYPPPFLLGMFWSLPFDVRTGYRIWFWLDALCAGGVLLVLWGWWRQLGRVLALVLALIFATLTAFPDNHIMGQVNLPVMALALAGLWAEERGSPMLGGAAMGLACMAKMSPALFVAWWMLRGRWRAVGAALGMAVLSSVCVLPWVSWEIQLRFYREILPQFASGDYNGLRVPIALFGNHSLPDVFHRMFPGQGGLSSTARTLSAVTSWGTVAGLAVLFRREPVDAWARWAQVGAVGVVMLLLPVYTYEHHVVWAIPAVAVLGTAVVSGRLHWRWSIPLVVAWGSWAMELRALKAMCQTVESAWQAAVLRDLKMFALLILLGACVLLGTQRKDVA